MLDVKKYYEESFQDEWLRLERHRTEFALSLRALQRWLPPPPANLLDIGSGPGRYAIALAQQGYSLTLVDLSQPNLDLAQENGRQAGVVFDACLQGDVLDLQALSLPHRRYDAVLVMGPLYHLLHDSQRRAALSQAVGLLVDGGVLFASFITRFAFLREFAQGDPAAIAPELENSQHILQSGQYDGHGAFTRAYFADPLEVMPLMESCGLETLDLLGAEGVLAGHEEGVNALQGELWEAWVDLNDHTARHPALLGAADHLLYAGRKAHPGDRAAAFFQGGYNCAQSLAAAFAPRFGLAPGMAARLAAPFGAGIARRAETCGAVSGALMVLGLAAGNAGLGDRDAKERAYRLGQEFMRRFQEIHGALECRRLQGYDLGSPDELQLARQAGVFDDICPGLVRSAAGLVESMLSDIAQAG